MCLVEGTRLRQTRSSPCGGDRDQPTDSRSSARPRSHPAPTEPEEQHLKIGILGTGQVARLLAAAWANASHEITLGSRDPGPTRLDVPVKALADTIGWVDVVVNATPGAATLATLFTIDSGRFAGKTVIDVANAYTPELALAHPNSSFRTL